MSSAIVDPGVSLSSPCLAASLSKASHDQAEMLGACPSPVVNSV
ncbi:hypothetical protein QOZ95_002016 [Paenibacillus brasilensis]|uniref:Uncharacterized protein n=1 Tax=Paenibacillus brasilensis TaxID=128574 RepID=A0ABU0L0H2_9BACL|nr:hypothetical protein [Paenibacillus brasilensis]